MNGYKKIAKRIVDVFTTLLLVILLVIIYGKLTMTFSHNKYPNYFGYTFFEVASGSMQPTLEINDVILVKIEKDDIELKDVIAFKDGNTIITHRVLFIDGDTLTVKGDNNNTIDKPINRNQVIGKMVKNFSRLGVWKKVLMEPKIIFVLFITLLLFDFALSYKTDEEKIKKEEAKEEKKEEVVIKKIVPEEEIESLYDNQEKLLEITKKIDLSDVNKLLEGTTLELKKEEINNVKEVINREEPIKKEDNLLNKKEEKFLEYTMRLDLDKIREEIDKKIS